MCGRYSLTKVKGLEERFGVAPPKEIQSNENISPGQFQPVITLDEDGPKMSVMKWGVIPFWTKDPKDIYKYKTFNARGEGIFEKKLWMKSIISRRCLIPADGFYEWKKLDDSKNPPKQKYFIRPKELELYAFAGIWDTWKDAEGHEIHSYSIITTDPNKEMRNVHDRMPVILHKDDESAWLDPANNEQSKIEELMRPLEDDSLALVEMGKDEWSALDPDKVNSK